MENLADHQTRRKSFVSDFKDISPLKVKIIVTANPDTDMEVMLELRRFLDEQYIDDYCINNVTPKPAKRICKCKDGCMSKESCACRKMTYDHAKRYNETITNDPNWSKSKKTIHPKNMEGCQYGLGFPNT